MRLAHPDVCCPTATTAWQSDVAQLLEEHHLCAWGRSASVRAGFALHLSRLLNGLHDTHVCVIDGRRTTDLVSFCDELARGMGLASVRATMGLAEGVLESLRGREGDPRLTPIKRRFYLWTHADTMLRCDPGLFGKLADALMGVAAESEYSSDDTLILQRGIFVGGPALDMYADDDRGQFRSWCGEGGGGDGVPAWGALTGISGPSVLRYEISGELVLGVPV